VSTATREKRKKKRGTSPTQRTMAELKDIGFAAGIVEKRVPKRPNITIDLFNCIDIVAIKEGVGILGVQATTGPNHAARRAKAVAEPRLKTWLLCGGRFEIWSWSKKGACGKRKLWALRRDELFAHDIGTSGPAMGPNPDGGEPEGKRTRRRPRPRPDMASVETPSGASPSAPLVSVAREVA